MAISNTSLTLAGPHLIILNNVDFQVGRIYSSSLNTLEFGNTSTSTGATDSGYVDGPVSKTGNQAFEFPVGKNGRFRPIEISAPPLATDQFTAEYISEDPNQYYDVTRHDPSIDHVSRCEYWNLRTAGPCLFIVELTAVTVPGDLVG
ncbi:MAG: hypothetical protein IPQ03_17730 [Bacteroidetes bacterium]|nr:hypothetical protein [Bacteroidota bacterium]